MQRRTEILFADDDPFYCELAKSTLEDAGYAVTTAANGPAALSRLAERQPRIAIIDLEMPGLDGFEVIARVRGERRHDAIPIIVLTGHDNEAAVERAYAAGATSFLVKPVNWPLFVQHVRFVLKAAQTEAELRETSRTARLLSDLKSRVVSMLVNEFQQPLRAALCNATLFRHEADGPLNSPIYTQAAADLYRTLEQLSAVHLRMIGFGRMLGESIVVEDARWALEPVIVEAIEGLREHAERRQIELEYDIAAAVGLEMRGDRALVSQAIKALLANAIRFAPRASSIGIEARRDPAGTFQLAVRDAAPPLTTEQVREALALPNDQASRIDDRSDRSGLTVGRLLVEAHQGSLGIETVPKGGNITSMTLPAARFMTAAAGQVVRPPVGRAVPIAVKQAGTQRLSLAVPRRPLGATG